MVKRDSQMGSQVDPTTHKIYVKPENKIYKEGGFIIIQNVVIIYIKKNKK